MKIERVVANNRRKAFEVTLEGRTLTFPLTLEAQKRVADAGISKREIIRRLDTSASQFYRLLDQTNYTKSIGQMLRLLHLLDCEVELVVRERGARSA